MPNPPATPAPPRPHRGRLAGCRHARPLGFTLIELMVVLSIIVIASAITFPFLGAMTRDLASSNGVNTVQAATTAARAYATRTKADIEVDGSGGQADYSGVAALFTPDSLIRLIENAGSGAGDARYLTDANGNALETAYQGDGIRLNGFIDIVGREPIQLDPNTGVVGIVRAPSTDARYPVRLSGGDSARLIPPPFAVWFSPSGSIVAGVPLANSGGPLADQEAVDRSRQRVVYYDGDLTRDLDATATEHIDVERNAVGNWTAPNRFSVSGTYDVDEFDPSSTEYDRSAAFNSDLNRAVLPFEEIEAVVGVLVYDKKAFRGAGLDWPATPSGQAIAEWLVDNGTAVFFSPTSGVAFREANQQ
jgi:prepilin-type N-terminal cleavage/methylation domain-containing protein